jgi:5-oxoprolinase (ATP-hydrolysing)
MTEQFGLSVVLAYMNHVRDNAEESVRRSSPASKTVSSRCRWTTARRSRSPSRQQRYPQRELFSGVAPMTNNAPHCSGMAAVLACSARWLMTTFR